MPPWSAVRLDMAGCSYPKLRGCNWCSMAMGRQGRVAVGIAFYPSHKSTQQRGTKRHMLCSFFMLFRQCEYFGQFYESCLSSSVRITFAVSEADADGLERSG